jgi:site-specific DNA-cytosine methylase
MVILRHKNNNIKYWSDKLKIYEAFAGKGTFSSAMKELNIPLEIVGYCEID